MSEGGKDVQISSFKDKIIKTALPLLHLVDVIKPGVINWSLIDKEGDKVIIWSLGKSRIIQYIFSPTLTMPNTAWPSQERLALLSMLFQRIFLR